MNTSITGAGSITRPSFQNKVLGLFGLAILSTGLGVYFGFNNFLILFAKNPLWMFGLFIAEFILVLTSRMWSKSKPLNYYLFSLFTFSSGVTLVPLLALFAAQFQGYEIIYRSLFATTATFLAAGIIGYTTKRNLASFGGLLFLALIGMLVIGIIGIFVPWGSTGEMLYSGLGVLVFSGYTIFDVNRIKEYPEDEYIMAAMQLYLDIFNLFISVLRLTGALSRK